MPNTFGDDLQFLQEFTDVLLLESPDGLGQVAVVPQWQGRVMTSTAGGPNGASFGWINYELIRSGELLPHINAFGGEDRFWMGPEGGQYAIFFKAGDPFDLDHWQTPPVIDTEPFDIVSSSKEEVVFSRSASLENYSGSRFDLRIDRTIRMLPQTALKESLGVTLSEGCRFVAFESINTLTNTGESAWARDSGLLSIWILGMYNPSPQTRVVIPYNPDLDPATVPIVNDSYFGKVPGDRLKVLDDVLLFSADGAYRSKIGLNPQRAQRFLGSWDASGRALTIVEYNQPSTEAEYVNSMWEIQEEPYKGDVVNSYNDGPPEPGAKPMGPFYELETSSPAAALAPGDQITHIHRTFHLLGDESLMNEIAENLLGVSLQEIETN
ncbi:MAG: hypothetical protein JSU96_06015 [Acidobacteriota bacterium]|nr:MAG: hypothetical protein JSU96_06015 [Acidobacteriota bacterium]